MFEFLQPRLCLCLWATGLLMENMTQHTRWPHGSPMVSCLCSALFGTPCPWWTYHGDCSRPSPSISHNPPNPQAQVFPGEESQSGEDLLRSPSLQPQLSEWPSSHPTLFPGRGYPASVSLLSYSGSCPLSFLGLIPLSPAPSLAPRFCLSPSSPNTNMLIACSPL